MNGGTDTMADHGGPAECCLLDPPLYRYRALYQTSNKQRPHQHRQSRRQPEVCLAAEGCVVSGGLRTEQAKQDRAHILQCCPRLHPNLCQFELGPGEKQHMLLLPHGLQPQGCRAENSLNRDHTSLEAPCNNQ